MVRLQGAALRGIRACYALTGLRLASQLPSGTGCGAYQFFAAVFASLDVSIALADDHRDPEQLSRAFRISNG
jgi:hypothetical protein